MTESIDSNVKSLGFDPVALREKYHAEREKRMDHAGNRKYRKIRDEFEGLYKDPNADPKFTREPVKKIMDFAIIGGGYGGLLCGAELRRVGVKDICIVERGADIGGTWYWNRYPGAACDVESYIYLPMLEEIGGMPERKYATAPEIWEHTKKIAPQVRPVSRCAAADDCDRHFLERRDAKVDSPNGPGRRDRRTLRHDLHRLHGRTEAAQHSRHRHLQGPDIPHQSLGLRLHGEETIVAI